jgi:hypothetical protein
VGEERTAHKTFGRIFLDWFSIPGKAHVVAADLGLECPIVIAAGICQTFIE